MAMTVAQANAAVREGVRRALDRGSFPQSEYDTKTIKGLRENLKHSLVDEAPRESDRLGLLRVSIRRRCRKKGWRVQTPGNSWYTASGNQQKLLAAIAQVIVSSPMEHV